MARLSGISLLTVAALCFALLPSTAFAEMAWWLTQRFTPAATRYEGLTARELHPKWHKFSVLSEAVLPAKAKSDLAWMRKQGFVFTRDGDFNHDGRPDRAIAGVYVDNAGRFGRLLLVLEQNRGGWRKAFLSTNPGQPGFSVLSGGSKDLYWSPCMECDVSSRLKPHGNTYLLAPAGHQD